MIKFGANIWSLPRDKRNIDQFMQMAKSIGYDGVELAIDDKDVVMSSSERVNKWHRIREQADNIGIEIPSIASGLYWKYNFIVDEDKALNILKIQREVARIVDAKIILIIPGVAVSSIDYIEHFNRASRALKKVSKIAREYDIIIGLEPVWNRLFPSPLKFKKLIEDVNEDNVRVYFDVANTLPHSLPEHWIKILGNYIVQIHVKDFSISKLAFGIPMTGDVNWNAVKQALKEINYKEYLVAEVPWDEKEPYKPLIETLTRIKEIFEDYIKG